MSRSFLVCPEPALISTKKRIGALEMGARGAVSFVPGRLRDGTLFLDKFGDIFPALQVRLLRVLEEHAYLPLGASKSVKADVRIVAPTHKDLEQLVEEGAFRKDLYYRINVVGLILPRLVARQEDIPLLAEHFIARFKRFGLAPPGTGQPAKLTH